MSDRKNGEKHTTWLDKTCGEEGAVWGNVRGRNGSRERQERDERGTAEGERGNLGKKSTDFLLILLFSDGSFGLASSEGGVGEFGSFFVRAEGMVEGSGSGRGGRGRGCGRRWRRRGWEAG